MPIWITEPPDQVLESGQTLDLQLEAWDLSGLYLWGLNDTTSFVITSVGRVINLGVVTPGSYNILVSVSDPYENTLSATITILVEDTLPPEWHALPKSQTLEFGRSFRYQLNANDPNGLDSWWLLGSNYFSIDASGFIVNSTLIPVGTYTLQVMVNDTLGHILTGSLNVVVIDTSAPYWVVEPIPQYIQYGEDLIYHLQAADLSGIDSWSINNTLLFDITSTGTIINTDILSPGIYYLLVTVDDQYGNSMSDVITIIVESSQNNFQFQLLVTGLVVVVVASFGGTLIFLKHKKQI